MMLDSTLESRFRRRGRSTFKARTAQCLGTLAAILLAACTTDPPCCGPDVTDSPDAGNPDATTTHDGSDTSAEESPPREDLISLILCDDARSDVEAEATAPSVRWAASGHKEILREAVSITDSLIGSDFYSSQFHELFKGNRATDYACPRLQRFYGWRNTTFYPDIAAWHYDPGMQNIHFLRNYEGRAQTAQEACVGSRALLKDAALSAMSIYAANQDDFFYLLGHAAHVVEDSFAPAHARRTGSRLRQFSNVCIFAESAPGSCEHESDLDDVDAAKRSADAAVRATVGLLRAVHAHLAENQATPSDGFLEDWFVNPSDEYAGYFDCAIVAPSCPGN